MLYSCSARVDTPVVTVAEIKYFKTSFFYLNGSITLVSLLLSKITTHIGLGLRNQSFCFLCSHDLSLSVALQCLPTRKNFTFHLMCCMPKFQT